MACTSRLIVIAVLFYSWSGTSARNLASGRCYSFSYRDDQVNEWGKCWPACNGDNQSPVNIETQNVITESLPPLDGSFLRERNNYHRFIFMNDNYTMRALPVRPGELYIEGGPLPGRYVMQHLLFSWGSSLNKTVGSEHAIDGKRYPLEGQWTFYNDKYLGLDEASKHKDGVMMISILFPYITGKEGNEMISELYRPIQSVSTLRLHNEDISYGPLFPAHSINDYYSYKGSWTRPPCFESVIWLVYLLDDGVDLTQLTWFWHMRNGGGTLENNFRSLQPLNCRQVVQSDKRSRVTDESTEGRPAAQWQDSRRRAAGVSKRYGAVRRPGQSVRHQ